jgi:hypothetical protein
MVLMIMVLNRARVRMLYERADTPMIRNESRSRKNVTIEFVSCQMLLENTPEPSGYVTCYLVEYDAMERCIFENMAGFCDVGLWRDSHVYNKEERVNQWCC